VEVVKMRHCPNVEVIDNTVTAIRRLFDIQDGGRPPPWIFKTWNFGNSYHIVRFAVHYFCVVKMIENNVLRVYKKNFASGALKYCLQTQLYLELVRLLVVAVQ